MFLAVGAPVVCGLKEKPEGNPKPCFWGGPPKQDTPKKNRRDPIDLAVKLNLVQLG